MKNIDDIAKFLGTKITEENKAIFQAALDEGRLTFDKETETFKYMLKSPIKLEDGSMIDILNIHELCGNDLRKVNISSDNDATGYLLEGLAIMNGHPSSVIGRMKMRDLTFLGNLMGFFV